MRRLDNRRGSIRTPLRATRKALALSMWIAIAAVVTAAATATGQATPKTPLRFGVLFWHDAPNDKTTFDGFRRGWEIAKRPVTYDIRHAQQTREVAERHLRAFREADVDAVLTLGTEATLAGRTVTDRPVIFSAVTNPFATKIVPDWAGSRRNLAGNSNYIDPDRVITEVRRAFPTLRALGVLRTKGNAVSETEIQGVLDALEVRASLGIRLAVGVAEDDAAIVRTAAALLDRVDALWIPIDYAVNGRIQEIAALARRARKPIITTNPRATPNAVVSILCDYHTLGMQAAAIADRVLTGGAEPGALPVGRLKGRILVLNIRAARAIDLALPVAAMAAADRIIPAPRPSSERATRERPSRETQRAR